MNKLNVFNQSYSPWRYPSNWIRNMRLFGRQFKWAYQRITRGFCDYDVWDLDSHLSELLIQTIKQLAKTSHGYPGTEEFPTYESWENYLVDIVHKLEYSLNDLPNEYETAWLKTWENENLDKIVKKDKTPEEEEITKKYLDKEAYNDKLKREAQNEALRMIYHVYNHLWD